MSLQKIIKEQRFNWMSYLQTFGGGDDLNEIEIKAMDKLLKEENAKIIEAVCEEMTGAKKILSFMNCSIVDGYNARVQEEVEKAKQLIKENLCQK